MLRVEHIKKLKESLGREAKVLEDEGSPAVIAVRLATQNYEATMQLVARQRDLEARLARVAERLAPSRAPMVTATATPMKVLEERVGLLRQRVEALKACCGSGPETVAATNKAYADNVRGLATEYDERLLKLFDEIDCVSSEVHEVLAAATKSITTDSSSSNK